MSGSLGGIGHLLRRHSETRFCIATFASSSAWTRVAYECGDRARTWMPSQTHQRNRRSFKGSGSILIEYGWASLMGLSRSRKQDDNSLGAAARVAGRGVTLLENVMPTCHLQSMVYIVQIVEGRGAETPGGDSGSRTYPLIARFSTILEAEEAAKREIARLANAGISASYKVIDPDGCQVGPRGPV
jgi:hypothetical protein